MSPTRLLTTGSSGRQTRLALRCPSCSTTTDGVWVVFPLTKRWSPTIATTSGRQTGRPDAIENVMRAPPTRRLLLVLDSCGTDARVRPVLRRGPAGHSRCGSSPPAAALRIDGERLFPVPSLTLPDPRRTLGRRADGLRGGAPVRRAGEGRAPGFQLSDRNAGPVGPICRRLDGIHRPRAAAAGCVSVDQIALDLTTSSAC
jgi:predicted ATPase